MHPHLWSSASGGLVIQSYGVLMAAGFLSGMYLAMRRAIRVKCDADIIVSLGLISLIVGTIGSRALFVIHYWDEHFAAAPNRLAAILDLRQGGVEYLGGLVPTLVVVVLYLKWKRVSLRLYADIMAIAIAWTLGFGRIGCFLNGCCQGDICVDAAGRPASPAAVRFPFGSPVSVAQWEQRKNTLPAELLLDGFHDDLDSPSAEAAPIGRDILYLPSNLLNTGRTRPGDARVATLLSAGRYPSREDPARRATPRELRRLALENPAVWAHPTQLYAAAAALLLSNFLARVFHRRRRHGIVFGLLLVAYAPARFLLEAIRVDNPVDTFGMTLSQAVSVGVMIVGVVWLIVVFRFLPQRSPRAEACVRQPRLYDGWFMR